MFRLKKKRKNDFDVIFNEVNSICSGVSNALLKRDNAVKSLVNARNHSHFYEMTQAVFDCGYDSINFDEVKEKYVPYFEKETNLSTKAIISLMKDIYFAGVENKKTNDVIDTFYRLKK